jgi:hypothetical protein
MNLEKRARSDRAAREPDLAARDRSLSISGNRTPAEVSGSPSSDAPTQEAQAPETAEGRDDDSTSRMPDWPASEMLAAMGLQAEEGGEGLQVANEPGGTTDPVQVEPESAPVVQRRSAGTIATEPAEPTSTGQPMSPGTRAAMEHSFGADFSAVKIHEGDHASALGAQAYTRGDDIHFAPGQYAPDTHGGRELLGHELAHVVQQGQGRASAGVQARGVVLNEDQGLEREADCPASAEA